MFVTMIVTKMKDFKTCSCTKYFLIGTIVKKVLFPVSFVYPAAL